MTISDQAMNNHPAPKAASMTLRESFFALFGGPIAWLVQFCAGYALASQPCFLQGERLVAPQSGSAWTYSAMIILIIGAIAVSLLAWFVSWRAYLRTRDEHGGDGQHLIETGAGRTRFLALWGMILGAGFALATVITASGFFALPRCAG